MNLNRWNFACACASFFLLIFRPINAADDLTCGPGFEDASGHHRSYDPHRKHLPQLVPFGQTKPYQMETSKLLPQEEGLLRKYAALRGGSFESTVRESWPGIDATHEYPGAKFPAFLTRPSLPIKDYLTLKQSHSPRREKFTRRAAEAEESARKAGYLGLVLVIDCPNLSQKALLKLVQDPQATDREITQILSRPYIREIWALCKDGWVHFPGVESR